MKKSGIVSYPSFQERAYSRYLVSLVKEMHLSVLSLVQQNESFQKTFNTLRLDDEVDDLETFLQKLRARILLNISFINPMRTFANNVSQFNLRSIFNSFPKTKFSKENIISKSDDELKKMWIAENVRLITSIKSSYHDQVASKVYDAIKNGDSVQTLAKNLQDTFKLTLNRAKLIATDQISKLNGQLTRARKLNLGLNLYVWSTVKDERVRKSHQVLEGKVCDFENAEIFKNSTEDKVWKKRVSIGGDTKHPQLAIRCRCTSYSVFA